MGLIKCSFKDNTILFSFFFFFLIDKYLKNIYIFNPCLQVVTATLARELNIDQTQIPLYPQNSDVSQYD